MVDKLILAAELDTTQVEKKLSDLEKRIKKMRETGPGGAVSQLAQQYRATGQDDKAQRLEQFRQRADQQNRKGLMRDLKDQESQMDKLLKKHQLIQNMVDNSISGEKTKTKLLEKQAQVMDEIARKSKIINSGQGILNPGGQPPGAPPSMMSRIGGMAGRFAGLAGTALTGIGTAAATYGNFQSFRAGLPVAQAGREVGIGQGATQLRARGIRGESAEDIIFAPERANSIGKSMDFFEKADSARSIRAKGKAALGGAGILAGAGAGALAGSAFGPLGTIAGGAIGGIGAGLGFFGNSEEAYYGLTGNQQALSQMTGKETMENYETFKLQDRMKDPRKYYQKKFLSENKDRLLQLQRSAGMNDEDMYGNLGFLRQGAGEFSFNERAGMQQSIVGAGGSGSGASKLNNVALQAQRSMGMTNAGQTMGRLSSYLNTQESEQAFVKILAKGVSVGLDDSKYREEQKDYFNQVTAIASNIGGGSDLVAASMAAGVEGDISRRGIGMAGDAFKDLSGILNQRGGVTAAARAGLMADDEAFSNIKGFDKLSFQNMKLEDMRGDNPVLQRFYKMAQEGGYEGTVEDFAKKRRDVQRQALIQPYKNTPLGKVLQEVFDKGSQGELSEEDVSAGQVYLKLIPGFEDKTDEELKVMLKSYSGSERILDESRKKQAEAQRKKKTIQKTKQNFGKGGVPYAKSGNFVDDMFAGLMPQAPGETLTQEEKRLTGDFSGTPTGVDQIKQAEARQQSKQFEKMGEMTTELFQNVFKNIDKTLADQVTMESFNEALKGGADAVETFLSALKGQKKKSTSRVGSKQQPIVK